MNKVAKNPGVAAVLSFFWCGLGQIYNGEVGKAVGFMLGFVVSVALCAVGIGFISTPILWIVGMVDAYQSAERLNNPDSVEVLALPVRTPAVEDVKSSNGGIAIAVGVVLVGAVMALAFMPNTKQAKPSGVVAATAAVPSAVPSVKAVKEDEVTWNLYAPPGKDVSAPSAEAFSAREERSYEISLDVRAPLGSWKNLDTQVDATVGKRQRTEEGCRQELNALLAFSKSMGTTGLYTREDRTEKAREEHLQCVASNDPRLKQERKYYVDPAGGIRPFHGE
jgi:TM2 domain-containing membrane protein YozV